MHVRAVHPRLGVGRRPDLTEGGNRDSPRPARDADLRRPLPRRVERSGLRVSPGVVGGGGRPRLEDRVEPVARRRRCRSRADDALPARFPGRLARLRARAARRAERLAPGRRGRRRRSRGGDRPARCLGGAQRRALRRLHRRAREQGVGPVLQGRRRRRPGERRRVGAACRRRPAECAHAAAVREPRRRASRRTSTGPETSR